MSGGKRTLSCCCLSGLSIWQFSHFSFLQVEGNPRWKPVLQPLPASRTSAGIVGYGDALTRQGGQTPHAQLHADGESEATRGSEVEDKSAMWTPLLGENMAGELSSLRFSLD